MSYISLDYDLILRDFLVHFITQHDVMRLEVFHFLSKIDSSSNRGIINDNS